MDFQRLYHDEYGRILATLIRRVGDFGLAEDALQEAFVAALEQWPREGSPQDPSAWVYATARHKAIDRLRRQSWLQDHGEDVERHLRALTAEDTAEQTAEPEDRLRLIFTCCHPALAPEAQIALTLRTLCGLTTEEIARAFLVSAPTVAQRIVRAKAKIRDARIPYVVPSAEALPERLDAAMSAIYLVFNEGYSSSFGERLVRADLSAESIRLGRLLVDLLPHSLEPRGLLALMLLHDARRATRTDAAGALLTLEEQDRTRWDRAQIQEGARLVESALSAGRPDAYALQAAIAALHAQAPHAADTDWPQIAALYGVLQRRQPSPVVDLNRAVAVAMADGLERGLELIERVKAGGTLARYHLLEAARADLLRRLGRRPEAAAAYREALTLVSNLSERRYLKRRLAEVV